MWLRGGTGEQGLQSMNFQAVGMFPWMQQRLDSTLMGNDPNQQYQAMLAAGLQNIGSGDQLRQHVMHFQQPLQYLQQPGSHNPLLQLQQQVMQQSVSHNMLQVQPQVSMENLPQHLLQPQFNHQTEEPQQPQNTYHDALKVQSEQLHQSPQMNVPSPSFSKTDFTDSSTKLSGSTTTRQNTLSSLCPEGSGNHLNISRAGHSMPAEQLPQQSWAPKFAHAQVNAFANSMSFPPFNEKGNSEQENCNSDSQNPTLFGVNIESSGLLFPTTVPNFATSSNDADIPMPLGNSGFQSSLYGCMQDSSELLHGAGQVDPPTPNCTFVKVCAENDWILLFSGSLSLQIVGQMILCSWCRCTSQGRLAAHWTSPGSAAIISCEKNWPRCLASRGSWKIVLDQAGSLYSSTGRTMCFFLETTHGSKFLIQLHTFKHGVCHKS